MKSILIPESISLELAEETGWHIGDGSMNYYFNERFGDRKGFYQLRGHIEDDREHYEKVIKPIFKLLYGAEVNLREMPSTRVYGFQIWNDEIVKFKEKLGLPLGKKFDIVIPDIFLGDNELKKAVIRGIFDTDGGIQILWKNNKWYPRIYIVTISNRLAKQLLDILRDLRFKATIYSWHDKRGNRQRAYKVSINGNMMLDKFFEVIKPNNPKHIRKYNLFKEKALNNL